MNINRLYEAQSLFLSKHPLGFADPSLAEINKKHNMSRLCEQASELFAKHQFNDPEQICESMALMVSRSSMVSMFEKPKFRRAIEAMSLAEKVQLSDGLKAFLYNKNQKKGFELMLEALKSQDIAKWTLITAVPNYAKPSAEVFIKPTTTKGVIKYFELEGLTYKPLPSWEFYQQYREAIHAMKQRVDASLSPSNAAFCGFLMTSL